MYALLKQNVSVDILSKFRDNRDSLAVAATLKISDTDFTDYTALHFINAAAFMKRKHCLNNDTIVQTIQT